MLSKLLLGIFLIASLTSLLDARKKCKLLSCNRVPLRKQYTDVRSRIALNKKPLYIDFGDCQANYSSVDDCELTECSRRCQPRAMERISVHSRTNPRIETVIKSCYAPKHACLEGCQRKPNYTFIFTGSAKYKQRVDIGKCVGECASEDSSVKCLPTKTTSKAFDGPNGAVVFDNVIEECACVSTKCYRVDYFESYTECLTSQNKNNTTENKFAEKLINVGKCIGTCPGVTVPARCLPSPEDCELRFGASKAYCVPLTVHEHTFIDQNDKERTISAIGECGCGSG